MAFLHSRVSEDNSMLIYNAVPTFVRNAMWREAGQGPSSKEGG